MEISREGLCYIEISKILEEKNEQEVPVSCSITEHQGFEVVFLNIWVLQTPYHQHQEHYTTAPPTALHEYWKTSVCIIL